MAMKRASPYAREILAQPSGDCRSARRKANCKSHQGRKFRAAETDRSPTKRLFRSIDSRANQTDRSYKKMTNTFDGKREVLRPRTSQRLELSVDGKNSTEEPSKISNSPPNPPKKRSMLRKLTSGGFIFRTQKTPHNRYTAKAYGIPESNSLSSPREIPLTDYFSSLKKKSLSPSQSYKSQNRKHIGQKPSSNYVYKVLKLEI